MITSRGVRPNRAPDTHSPAADWRQRAACRDEDPDVFFPVPTDHAGAEDARRICLTCPVMQLCGQWALETRQDYGVWGALTEEERARLRRRRRPRRRRGTGTVREVRCGTDAGYRRHVRDKTAICQPCRDAHTLTLTERATG